MASSLEIETSVASAAEHLDEEGPNSPQSSDNESDKAPSEAAPTAAPASDEEKANDDEKEPMSDEESDESHASDTDEREARRENRRVPTVPEESEKDEDEDAQMSDDTDGEDDYTNEMWYRKGCDECLDPLLIEQCRREFVNHVKETQSLESFVLISVNGFDKPRDNYCLMVPSLDLKPSEVSVLANLQANAAHQEGVELLARLVCNKEYIATPHHVSGKYIDLAFIFNQC